MFCVTIDWVFKYFFRKNIRISPKTSLFVLLLFCNVCSASLLMRVWKQLILFSSIHWLWILTLVWNRPPNSSKFIDFPSKEGNVVVGDLSGFENCLLLFLNFAEFPLLTNYRTTSKIWCASFVIAVFSVQYCGWLVVRAFFCFTAEVQRSKRRFFLEPLSPGDNTVHNIQPDYSN